MDYINKLISQNSKGNLYLKSFKKIDGLESNGFGIKEYDLEFKMEIGFVESCTFNYRIMGSGSPYIDFTTNEPHSNSGKIDVLDKYNEGDVIKFDMSQTFIKKESGWKMKNNAIFLHRKDKFNF